MKYSVSTFFVKKNTSCFHEEDTFRLATPRFQKWQYTKSIQTFTEYIFNENVHANISSIKLKFTGFYSCFKYPFHRKNLNLGLIFIRNKFPCIYLPSYLLLAFKSNFLGYHVFFTEKLRQHLIFFNNVSICVSFLFLLLIQIHHKTLLM